MAVSFVAVARMSDKAVLASKAEKLSRHELQYFEEALTELVDKAARLPAYSGWSDKLAINTNDTGDLEGNSGGTMYALADAQALCIVLVGVKSNLYPERVARELLQELAAKLLGSPSLGAQRLSEARPRSLTAELKAELKEAIKSYSDPTKADKVTQVHAKVDQVKGLMQENVKKILETHVTLEHLQNQSHSMTDSANTFLKNSTAMRRQTQWQNWKVKLAVGASIGIVVVVTAFPLLKQVGAI